MTLVLGIDLETTGPEDDAHITEVAGVLWDVDSKRLIDAYSTLVKLPDGVEYPEEAQKVAHLSAAQVEAYGKPLDDALLHIYHMATYASYMVAHNAQFEKTHLENNETGRVLVDFRRWIDTMDDLPLPDYYKGSHGLGALAYESGLHNPFPHCALGDTLVMVQLLSSFPFHLIEKRANAETVRLEAQVSFDDKDKAKEAGFRWDPAPAKKWFKEVKDFEAQDVANRCDFIVYQVGPNLRHNLSVNKPVAV